MPIMLLSSLMNDLLGLRSRALANLEEAEEPHASFWGSRLAYVESLLLEEAMTIAEELPDPICQICGKPIPPEDRQAIVDGYIHDKDPKCRPMWGPSQHWMKDE